MLKACRLIEEAGRNGARLVTFPEAYVPGYPYWIRYLDPFKADNYTRDLVLQSVRIPSEHTETICEAARKANVYVVMGLSSLLNQGNLEEARATLEKLHQVLERC